MWQAGQGEVDDEQLLTAIATARDPDALARLYDRYGGLAQGLALRMVNDAGASEEIVQESFFNVWRNAARYSQERGSARTWIMSIVHHQAIDKLRRIRSKQSLDSYGDVPPDALQQPDVWTDVAAGLERERISQALRGLPQEQRATIELAYFGGFSHSEIARLLRIPLGTVKGRLRLGMDKLRSSLAEPNLGLSAQ
jgi:RNA polymerase sigma-70 factor, ECF subfamily